jgi:ABC-type glycerol-3-phosphate transport system permease component
MEANSMADNKSGAVKSTGAKIGIGVIYVFLIFVSLLTLYPILYVVFGSFKGNQELLLGGLNLLPKKFIVSNYTQAWKMGNFGLYTMNSIFLSLSVMIIVLINSSMAGYCFARKNFFMKNFIYAVMIAFMFINVGSISLRPLFELAVKLKLNNSLWGVIFIAAGATQATNIFLVRGYMNTIPKELDEAAKIDGCTFFQTYWKIILPVLKPVLATIGLLSFRSAWNEYILPLVFTMSNVKLRPLTVGVVSLRMAGDGAAAWNIMFAGSAISIIPIIVIYMFTSKYFMSGLTSGAVKG